MLRVALHLTRDPHRAEDVVQATFLLAMREAPAFEAGRRVLPWLLGLLANQARHAHPRIRSTTPHAPSWSGPCERRSSAFAQPYRPVLVLHLERGLAAHGIADVIERPAGTVRTQIARGMEMLRKRFPAGSPPAVSRRWCRRASPPCGAAFSTQPLPRAGSPRAR